MAYILIFLLGTFGGAACLFIALEGKRRVLNQQIEEQKAQKDELQKTFQDIEIKKRELNQSVHAWKSEIDTRQHDLDAQAAAQESALEAKRREIETRIISYKELQDENAILKRDIQNIDVNLRKLELDRELQREDQEKLDKRSRELAEVVSTPV